MTFVDNQIHSVFQRGNTFYVLNNSAEGLSPAQVTRFNENPGRHADFTFFFQNTDFIVEIVLAQRNQAPANQQIQFDARSVGTNPWDYVFMFLPLLLLIGFFVFIMRAMSGRGSGISGMGRHRAQMTRDSNVRFGDVAGIEEEKEEVREIVQFLRNPKKFLDLGARIPKGFLLIGSPGTGKTLLAKAIAGEANVPFFSISGSDFSEMLVGVGPSRMRDLFEQAKANAPCIIFIDEIDSIARMRGVGISGAAEENEQTLNQLLVQMDGFTKSEGVIVLAATNRPDVLDQALLRPGRFDRQIVVQMPDVAGREKILKVHAKSKPLAADVDLKRVAQIISGFTGADIENLMNEAAIIAAKRDRRKITMVDITEGINKVLLGPQKKSRIITEEDKKITAFHEAGHAVVSYMLQPKQVVQEVSIVPRGMAAGYTLTNDQDDVTAHKSKSFLKTQLAVYMGGRAAEAVFIGDYCTGATQDIKMATGLAERMVTQFGMSEKLGPLYFGRHDEAMMRAYEDKRISDKMQELIDSEVRAFVEEGKETATKIMNDKRKEIKLMVDVLLERETIYKEDVELIMSGAKKDDVLAQIEARLTAAKEAEAAEKIESLLESLNRDLDKIREMAKLFIAQGIRPAELLEQLEVNFEMARGVVRGGGRLEVLPTLDNVDNYANLVKVEKTEEVKEEVTDETK
ncbi:MAG: ATP-dependent zinc metalloprotease FtsH [Firmicutes bacterium]|nr:ATP-dependent zinc metalloprotease FtsH [Bacillota bacterium]